MKLHLICIGKQCPSWINDGFNEYWRRLKYPLEVELHEINTAKRNKTKSVTQLKQQDSDAILTAIPERSHVVALDEHGQHWNTNQLAEQMQKWQEFAKPVALLVGGPDGLSTECLQHAQQTWSLSTLTFPHPLVRVIVAEQLYRAQSILMNHPYHRE